MFNSIRKDDSCRKLVKSFEILRLQNKIIVQAMSAFTESDGVRFAYTKGVRFATARDVTFFQHSKKSKPVNNYNCFTDLELCKSNLHFFAKKRVKAENTIFSSYPPSLLSLAKGRIISLPRNSSKSRIKNRCIETGRSHSVLRFCKLSRIRLRDNASKALISGLSKASW